MDMKKTKKILILIPIILLLIILTTVLILQKNEQQNLYKLILQDQTIFLKPAITPQQKSQGLMFITNLPKNQGMIFIYSNEQPHSFWMKNTLVPLDIIFLNKNFQVIDIKQNVPPCKQDPCSTYQAKKPAQYVIEINAGLSQELAIKEGDKLTLTKLF